MIQLKKKKLVKSENYLTISTSLKIYLQSFLAWIKYQNPDFEKYIRPEEAANYFINGLEHPLWFSLYLKRHPFETIAEVTQYLTLFITSDKSSLCEERITIYPKDTRNILPSNGGKQRKAAPADECLAKKVAGLEDLNLPKFITYEDCYILKKLMKGTKI